MKNIIIGITDCNKWKNYYNWFASKNVEVINLSYKKNNLEDVYRCDGIVLSGGEDVHPKYYGRPAYMKKKKKLKLEVNEPRDKFELKVIDTAVKSKKPILGICRGLQITNVYFKGTLIPNLPEKIQAYHSKREGYDQTHEVIVKKNSCLNEIVHVMKGTVNSAHHQSAKKIGKGLKVTATDTNGIVEALEWKNPKKKPFLLLVQWHPERMKNQKSPFAKNLRKKFLQKVMAAKKFS
jgi:putative glutamine amidotransferase